MGWKTKGRGEGLIRNQQQHLWPKRKPLYFRVWPVAPLLVLAGTWTVVTFLPTDSPDDLVPVHQTWTLMGTILEATVYRPASAKTLAHADLEARRTTGSTVLLP